MKVSLWLLIAGGLMSSCANIVTPTGGLKDTQPPKVVQATPDNLSTRFTWNKITVTFDEYVKLDNPAQEIIISPSIQPEPKILVKGKKLEIDLKGANLDSNTTYTINFGGSLKDVNESNVLDNFQYVFSTGDMLDSLYIFGRVIQAKDGKPAAKVLVMLHREMSDSSLLKERPYYFTKVGTDGGFQFNHLSGGTYRLYALKDENFNYLFDLPNEELAFQDSPLTVDTSITGLILNLFKEEREFSLKRTEMDDSKQGYFKLTYSKGVNELDIVSFEDGLPVAIPEYNPTADSILAWYTRAINADSLKLIVNKDSSENITVRNMPDSNDSLKRLFSTLSFAKSDSLIPTDGFISVLLTHPVELIEFDRVGVEQDSPKTAIPPSQIKFAEGSKRHIMIDFQRKPETSYSILFPEGTMTNYFGTINDSLTWKVRTKAHEDYGSMAVSINGTDGQHYIMQLVSTKNESLVKELAFDNSIKVELNKILPGSYEIRIIYDSNANGKWDTGNFMLHLQPEKTYAHPEKVNVRANWDMEVELNLK